MAVALLLEEDAKSPGQHRIAFPELKQSLGEHLGRVYQLLWSLKTSY